MKFRFNDDCLIGQNLFLDDIMLEVLISDRTNGNTIHIDKNQNHKLTKLYSMLKNRFSLK